MLAPSFLCVILFFVGMGYSEIIPKTFRFPEDQESFDLSTTWLDWIPSSGYEDVLDCFFSPSYKSYENGYVSIPIQAIDQYYGGKSFMYTCFSATFNDSFLTNNANGTYFGVNFQFAGGIGLQNIIGTTVLIGITGRTSEGYELTWDMSISFNKNKFFVNTYRQTNGSYIYLWNTSSTGKEVYKTFEEILFNGDIPVEIGVFYSYSQVIFYNNGSEIFKYEAKDDINKNFIFTEKMKGWFEVQVLRNGCYNDNYGNFNPSSIPVNNKIISVRYLDYNPYVSKENNNNNNNNNNDGNVVIVVVVFIVIGVIIGLITAAIIAILVLFLILVSKKAKKLDKIKDVDLIIQEQEVNSSHQSMKIRNSLNPNSNLRRSLSITTPKINIDAEMCKIDINDLKITRKIGQGGGNASVFMANWKGQVVAYKVFSFFSEDEEGMKSFEKELSVVSSLRHPNIVSFYGAVLDAENRIGIIQEYCDNGDLVHFLQTFKEKNNSSYPFVKRFHFLSEIANGIEFLHSKGIIHRDLKPENVLITKDECVRVSDFGCSSITKMIEQTTRTRSVGTSLYMAPEVLKGQYDSKCDVFSLAILCFVILTENFKPYGDVLTFDIEKKVASDETFRPFFGDNSEIPLEVKNYIKGMWAADPNLRPNMQGVIVFFTNFDKSLQEKATQ